MMKKILSTGLVIVALFAMGCATTGTQKQKVAYVPKFDYTPPSTASDGVTDLTFGLVAPSYSENQPWTRVWPFTVFSKNMAADFQELLIARGFKVLGPFQSIDEMTYPDKKGCDLILSPILEVSLDVSNTSTKEVLILIGKNQYRREGTAFIGGRVTLSLAESLTNQRMWFKSIELPQTSVPWHGEKKYNTPPPPGSVDFSDPGFNEALGPAMEKLYTTVLQTAWDHLHPEEMAMIRNQSKELRAKKVY